MDFASSKTYDPIDQVSESQSDIITTEHYSVISFAKDPQSYSDDS